MAVFLNVFAVFPVVSKVVGAKASDLLVASGKFSLQYIEFARRKSQHAAVVISRTLCCQRSEISLSALDVWTVIGNKFIQGLGGWFGTLKLVGRPKHKSLRRVKLHIPIAIQKATHIHIIAAGASKAVIEQVVDALDAHALRL